MNGIVRWIKNNKSITIIILVGIPLSVYIVSAIPIFPSGANNDWAGFWGGYIGAIIGGAITWMGVNKTISHEKEVKLDEKRISVLPVFHLKIDKMADNKSCEALLDVNKALEENEKESVLFWFEFTNIGNKAAQSLEIGLEINEKRFPGATYDYLVPNGESVRHSLGITVPKDPNKEQSFRVYWEYYDILDNRYYQYCNIKLVPCVYGDSEKYYKHVIEKILKAELSG